LKALVPLVRYLWYSIRKLFYGTHSRRWILDSITGF